MTNHTEDIQKSLVVPILSALVLILGAAALIWATQIRPVIQAAQAQELPGVNEALAKSARQAETVATSAPDHPVLGDPAAGQSLFTGTCSACHGPAGEGIQGLGKDLTTSQF